MIRLYTIWQTLNLQVLNESLARARRGHHESCYASHWSTWYGGGTLTLDTDTMSNVRHSRVKSLLAESLKTIARQIVEKLEPYAVLSALAATFKYWPEDQKQDLKKFLCKIMRVCVKFSKYWAKGRKVKKRGKNVTSSKRNGHYEKWQRW